VAGRKKPADVAPVDTAPAVERVKVEEPAVPPSPVEAFVAPVEPVVPVSTPAVEPVAAPQPAVAPAGEADNLLRLKGVGPKLNALLIELGVTRYSQIAAWGDADIAAIDAKLGSFKGRPVRDQWVDQAKYLAAGDSAGFEAKYGKL
jgi:predicted flap endonuclease-1-like 5' DNA nuclease